MMKVVRIQAGQWDSVVISVKDSRLECGRLVRTLVDVLIWTIPSIEVGLT